MIGHLRAGRAECVHPQHADDHREDEQHEGPQPRLRSHSARLTDHRPIVGTRGPPRTDVPGDARGWAGGGAAASHQQRKARGLYAGALLQRDNKTGQAIVPVLP